MLNVNDAARETPNTLRSIAAERVNYSRTIRDMRWSAGPVFVVAAGASIYPARSAALAIECLLGWPAVAHGASTFLKYSIGALRPRSTLIVLAPGGPGSDEEDLAEVASQTGRRGARVLALTASESGRVAQASQAWARLPASAGPLAPLIDPVAEQSAVYELVTAAARILNPRNQLLAPLEAEFDELPDHAARMHFQLADPLRACAGLIAAAGRVTLAGAGFFDAPAWRSACIARAITRVAVSTAEVDSVLGHSPSAPASAGTFLLLSTARCRNKQHLLARALALQTAGARLLALTSGNDRELIRLSELAALLPEVSEIPASVLSLVFLEWLLLETASGRATEPGE